MPKKPQLSPEQVTAISNWADRTSACIIAVRIFGSRARGDARPDSDIDVAITLDDLKDTAGGSPCLGLYVSKGDEWQQELRRLLGCHVSLQATEHLPEKALSESLEIWRR